MDTAAHHHVALWSLHDYEGKDRFRAAANVVIFSRRLRASNALKKSPEQAPAVGSSCAIDGVTAMEGYVGRGDFVGRCGRFIGRCYGFAGRWQPRRRRPLTLLV